jgi:hypothetical protein
MSVFKMFGHKKRRKYPILRDPEGRSLRTRCFERFAQGRRPVEVAEELHMKVPTAYSYFRDWQRLDPNFDKWYAYAKDLFKKTVANRDQNIELFAQIYGISKDHLESVLSQPHGLLRLLTGRLHFPAHVDLDRKRHMALELAVLISDHLVNNGGTFEDVYYAFRRWMKENQKYREEEDADIGEQNHFLEFVHGVLAAAAKQEREERVKPDTLSEEERTALVRYGLETQMKKLEMWYWYRVGSLKAEGLTPEQAREKIYQDLINKGDLKEAKLLRGFQDKVHPLKTEVQSPPPSPLSPSSQA